VQNVEPNEEIGQKGVFCKGLLVKVIPIILVIQQIQQRDHVGLNNISPVMGQQQT
jgi:hypothetical protein